MSDKQTQKTENTPVGGFRFQTSEDALAANQEEIAIRYLRGKLKMDDPEMLLKVYQKAIDARTFQTPIGLRFMQELRDRMLDADIPEERIPIIPLRVTYISKVRDMANPAKVRIKGLGEKKPRGKIDKFAISVWLNIFLAILVAGMVFLALRSETPNMLNYRNAILNEYSEWEDSLTERENALREAELEWKKTQVGE
ncbi:MAG: hypothetical protein IIU45_06425 [Lachnospiraceae bacterium]|jgi:hypothetical protein|nr:hypothetical protein [Lachnospiraceae bacterium]MBQ5376486.1 hypothetical protein [Lachnospiraceae bacterium]MBR1849292.1 hypothetical protein [Lachnospiraceae bacterium]